MKIIIALLALMVSMIQLSAQTVASSISKDLGTRVIPGDFADPSIILVDGTYYATGTSSEWAPHFPIFKSNDLVNWKQIGYVFDHKPEWTASSFWAPELFYQSGKFYVYYVARKSSDNTSCIGVATSNNPANGFTDHGILLETGKEAIDPFVFRDEKQLYITWKAYGLDNRPIEILGATLSNDGLKVTGNPFTLLKDNSRLGLEGQCIVKHGQYYYLLYSVGNCCGSACSYSVNVARSSSLKGKFEDFKSNPLLHEDENWKCPGHGTLVQNKGGQWYYLYHAYNKADNVFTGRQGMITEVSWQQDWPSVSLPNLPKPTPSTTITDNFTGPLSKAWQWDFRHSAAQIQIKDSILCLSGAIDTTTNKTGTVVTLRPTSGNYTMRVTVEDNNNTFKGLTVYGDASESAGIGTNGKVIQVWSIQKNVKSTLKQVSLAPSNHEIGLMISVVDGHKLKFSYSEANAWKEITIRGSFLDGNFLPPWDRSPRPGLYHNGAPTDEGCFKHFSLVYP